MRLQADETEEPVVDWAHRGEVERLGGYMISNGRCHREYAAQNSTESAQNACDDDCGVPGMDVLLLCRGRQTPGLQ